MAERARCEICDRNFKDAEGLGMHNAAKHPENIKEPKKSFPIKKIRNWAIFIIIIGGIFVLLFSGTGSAKTLPPTDMQGHIEASPPSHVLKEPMRIEIQKHMLEHVDGQEGVGGGVIINYDCNNYDCGPDLVNKLELFAGKYNYVYVAPFKNMDVKIALTKLGRIETLEEYNEDRIELFITGSLPKKDILSTPLSGEVVEETVVKEFTMTAKQWVFIPDTIKVKEGDNVVLNIKSIDVAHGIGILEFGVNEYLSPGNTVKIEFTADKKGEFGFFCNVQCGAGHAGMRGKIIVE